MKYPKERKEAVLKKMLPPDNMSVPQIATEEGISEATIYNWRKEARAQGRLLPEGDSTPQGWTSRDKFAAVVETAAMNAAELSQYCRRRGLYPEQLQVWRRACEQANDYEEARVRRTQEEIRALKRKQQELELESRRKEKALVETAALLVLKKRGLDMGVGEDA
jgi:transposase-like protein